MTWKTQLRPASFRGVPFKVSDSDFSTGRRIVGYEYPEREIGSTEDLGRKKREYVINAYVIGDDYLDQKNALIAACEDEKGPGELIHPFYGSVEVVCKECKVRESMTADGGMAIFALVFAEAGLIVDPSAKADSKESILAAADKARKASQSKFARAFSVSKMPGQVLDAAQAKITQAHNAIQNSPIRGSIQDVAALSGKITLLQSNSVALLNSPGNLASFLGDAIKDLKGVTGSKKESASTFMALTKFGAMDNVAYSANAAGIAQKNNDEAFNNFMREQAIIGAVETVIDADFDNLNDIENSKEAIVDVIDSLLDTTDDEFYLAMTEMKSVFVENFPDPSLSLPQISEITLNTTLPSLVVAYQLYGDSRRESEIVTRNKIKNPAFIPGGTVLEVLSE